MVVVNKHGKTPTEINVEDERYWAFVHVFLPAKRHGNPPYNQGMEFRQSLNSELIRRRWISHAAQRAPVPVPLGASTVLAVSSLLYFCPRESMLKLCPLENKFSFFYKKELDISLEGW